MDGYFDDVWISSDSARMSVTRAAALKDKATETLKRRTKAKLDAWILTEGPKAKKRVVSGLPSSSPGVVAPEVQAGVVAGPPGQVMELRAPVGVCIEEIEAAWALVARASSALRSASAHHWGGSQSSTPDFLYGWLSSPARDVDKVSSGQSTGSSSPGPVAVVFSLVSSRLLKIRHLYGIWSGLIPYRLRLDTLSEYPEP